MVGVQYDMLVNIYGIFCVVIAPYMKTERNHLQNSSFEYRSKSGFIRMYLQMQEITQYLISFIYPKLSAKIKTTLQK